MNLPKYARLEFERRFLVDPESDWRRQVKRFSQKFHDRYLVCGRLRTRRMEDSDTGRVNFKLTKKFGSESMLAHPMVSITLTAFEYEALSRLDGYDLNKFRYYHEQEGTRFSVDLFQGELSGLVLCEAEADSLEALRALSFPDYARWEVSDDEFFRGGNLCRATRAQLQSALARFVDAGYHLRKQP